MKYDWKKGGNFTFFVRRGWNGGDMEEEVFSQMKKNIASWVTLQHQNYQKVSGIIYGTRSSGTVTSDHILYLWLYSKQIVGVPQALSVSGIYCAFWDQSKDQKEEEQDQTFLAEVCVSVVVFASGWQQQVGQLQLPFLKKMIRN